MSRVPFDLGSIRVASPCSELWDKMEGDSRVRHCRQCAQNVYNFSGMTSGEIAELLEAEEGRLCVRFYRRADGKILTADCGVGGTLWGRLAWKVSLAALVLFLFFGVTVLRFVGGKVESFAGHNAWRALWGPIGPPEIFEPQVMGGICPPELPDPKG